MKVIQVLVDKLPKNVTYKWIIVSTMLISAGALMTFYIGPTLVKFIVKLLFVAKPGHFVRKMHEGKLRFTYKLYLWNVTNPNEITAGSEKPKLQEVGPYVFNVFKRKVNVTDNNTEDTVSFNFLNTFTYNPQLSAPLTGNEMVTIPNAVILSSMIKVQLESPHYLKILVEALDIIFKQPSTIFITMKAMDFLENGIQIDCNHKEYATKVVCAEMRRINALKVMNPEKTILRYRWFDRVNDTTGARYTIMRGSKNIKDVGRVIALNEHPTLKVHENEKCNIINGTDAVYLPPFQRKDENLWAFSNDACKSFPLRYSHKKTVNSVRTAYKSMYFSDPMMNPACECNKFNGCVASGTLDLYPCFKIFISISAPHFYLADPSLRERIEGMKPSESLHDTGCYIELETGVALSAHTRIQVNFLLKPIPEYRIFSSITGPAWLPFLWYEESFKLEKTELALLTFFNKISQILRVVIGYTLMIAGGVGVIYTTTLLLYKYNQEKMSIESQAVTSQSSEELSIQHK